MHGIQRHYLSGGGGYGTYVDFYLSEFRQSLNDYLARLCYAEDWTWFGEDGSALSDEAVAAMTDEDLAEAFLKGRYAKGSSGNGGRQGGPGGDEAGTPPDGNAEGSGNEEEVGTPDAGTTQSASSSKNSANYSSFQEMLSSYQSDIAEIEAGDAYGNNIVELYNPINYIGAEGTNNPAWTRLLIGASEGDISMFNSLNLRIAWLNAGTDAELEWQWDGGHVPSEILGDSLPLYVDRMYGKHAPGAKEVTKAAATGQTVNGTATEATGTDISGWVTYSSENGAVFSLADAAAYRTKGPSKAIPGFDVMDYGQEDYVFGSSSADARHWDRHVLEVFEAHQEELAELFDQ